MSEKLIGFNKSSWQLAYLQLAIWNGDFFFKQDQASRQLPVARSLSIYATK